MKIKKIFTDFLFIAPRLFILFILYSIPGGVLAIFVSGDSKSPFPLWQVLFVSILLALILVLFIYYGKKFGIADWKFSSIKKDIGKIVFAFGITLALNYLLPFILGGIHTSANQQNLNVIMSRVPLFLSYLLAAILAPVCEETIFRAGIFEWMFPAQPKVALVFSTLSFAAVHMVTNITDWKNWIVYGSVGLVLGVLYSKTRKVEVTATVHFLWNTYATITNFFGF